MVHCGLREKRRGIARVDENLAVAAAFLFDARFRSRGNAHSKIATADKRGKIRKLLRSHGSGRYLTSAWGPGTIGVPVWKPGRLSIFFDVFEEARIKIR
jgi:hypothetical protein